MNNPSQITIMPQQKTAERVEQTLYHVGREDKFALLLGLMRREGDRFLIFSNTREEARRLEDRLIRNGWDARALTGDVDQKRRLKIMNDFKEGVLPVLVATDVASRGLHIEAVSHVINWDLPQDPEDYVHRIGRTARAAGGAWATADRGRRGVTPSANRVARRLGWDGAGAAGVDGHRRAREARCLSGRARRRGRAAPAAGAVRGRRSEARAHVLSRG